MGPCVHRAGLCVRLLTERGNLLGSFLHIRFVFTAESVAAAASVRLPRNSWADELIPCVLSRGEGQQHTQQRWRQQQLLCVFHATPVYSYNRCSFGLNRSRSVKPAVASVNVKTVTIKASSLTLCVESAVEVCVCYMPQSFKMQHFACSNSFKSIQIPAKIRSD